MTVGIDGSRLRVGIDFQTPKDPSEQVAPGVAARLVEELELDSLWAADNLVREDKPILDCMLVLAAAAAVTDRIGIAAGVIQLPLRATAWVAKQAATMQVISEDRFIFGVGVGGTFPSEWAAAGTTTARRGARTDEMLAVLPDLIAGRPARPADALAGEVTLQPAVPVPPIWVGGGSPPARRRVARFGDGWLPAVITPEELKAAGAEIAEVARQHGRTAPRLGVQLHGDVRAARGDQRHRELVEWMSTRFSKPGDVAEHLVLTGSPRQVAERLEEYAEAGAEQIVVAPLGGGWQRQAELLAEARRHLTA